MRLYMLMSRFPLLPVQVFVPNNTEINTKTTYPGRYNMFKTQNQTIKETCFVTERDQKLKPIWD